MFKSGNPLSRLNREMKVFLVKLIIFIITWEALYVFLFKPKRILDSLLTEWLTFCVTGALNFFFNLTPRATWINDTINDASLIQRSGKTVLTIFDDCNGLDLFIIYLAFILLLPYPSKRKWIFSIGGLIAIFIGNIFRCVSLYWIYMHFRGMFDFNHHYIFTIFMYLIIFYGWVLFTKKPLTNEIR